MFALIRTLVSEKESRIKNEEIRGVREEAAHSRFMRAIELLSEKEPFKISGAIVELKQIGLERSDLRDSVQHILAKFVREQSLKASQEQKTSTDDGLIASVSSAPKSSETETGRIGRGEDAFGYSKVASIREAMEAIRRFRPYRAAPVRGSAHKIGIAAIRVGLNPNEPIEPCEPLDFTGSRLLRLRSVAWKLGGMHVRFVQSDERSRGWCELQRRSLQEHADR